MSSARGCYFPSKKFFPNFFRSIGGGGQVRGGAGRGLNTSGGGSVCASVSVS
jgi:hypothetical protein